MTYLIKKLFTAFFLAQILMVIPFVFVSAENRACRSDVRGYCAYSAPEQFLTPAEKKEQYEFAAEAENFVVPGLEFLQIPAGAELGDVLIKVYTFLLGLVGISSLLMFVWGGISYATATEGGVKEAKQKISNAATGLAIALIAYLGLITINPNFVKTLDIALQSIDTPKGAPIEGANCSTAGDCEGTYKKRPDGTLFCETDPKCVVNNPNVCVTKVKCPDGKIEVANKIFRTAEQCQKGCDIPRTACTGFESYEVIEIGCGIEKF